MTTLGDAPEMSTALTVRQSTPRNRKPQIFAGLLLAKNNDAEDVENAVPFSAGSGAPNHNALIAGEVYLRTDGTAAAGTMFYIATNTSGTWAPLVNLGAFAPTVISLTDNAAAALDIKEGSTTYLKFVTTDGMENVAVGKPLLLNGGLAPGSKFTSTEQTGTGASQNIAHGLGTTPSLVWWAPSSLSGNAATFVPGAHDATNVKMTVTNGEKYYVFAVK